MTSPSQNSEELESFLTKFEHSETYVDSSIPVKSSVSVILDDFNAKSTSWWSNEIDSAEGTKSSSSSFSTSNGFHQWIGEPTHIQRNCSSFDLTFTDQPSSVESTHHYTQAKLCHHQIIHCTFNLNIVYPLLVNTQFGTTKKLMFQIYKKTLQLMKCDRLLDNKCQFWSTSFQWHYIKYFQKLWTNHKLLVMTKQDIIQPKNDSGHPFWVLLGFLSLPVLSKIVENRNFN